MERSTGLIAGTELEEIGDMDKIKTESRGYEFRYRSPGSAIQSKANSESRARRNL